jgi:hypothetical protein
MSHPPLRSPRDARLDTVVALARLLQRIENSTRPVDPDAYRLLVRRLQAALAEDLPEAGRRAVLEAFPAAAEIYENLHYAQAGLALAPIDRSVATEMRTTELLARIARDARGPAAP